MDNLSHTVAGLAAAELIHRGLPAEPAQGDQRTRHRMLLVSCALASNFPDLDLVLTPLLPAPLGYLLHHRGHTHTFLYALPQALFLCALLWLVWPKARDLLRRSGAARWGLALTMSIGFGLHMGMDFLNSYGIHPFHPFDSRWLYGDMVFIIEPMFWVALGVPLILMIQRSWLRIGLLALIAAVLGYFSFAGFLHWASLGTLLALGTVLVVLRHRERAHAASADGATGALLSGAGALAIFVLVQAAASHQAERHLNAALARIDPASTVLDSARTAFPSNPLCWNFVSIESDEARDSYRLRRGVLSIAPSLQPVDACPPQLAERPGQQAVSPALALLMEHEGSLTQLRSLHGENCHFEAWMRFARAPQVEGGVASDARFGASPRGNFTAMDLAAFDGKACPRHVPRWAFPRADLIEGRQP